MIGCCTCSSSLLGQPATLKAGCPIHGRHPRDVLYESIRRQSAVFDTAFRQRMQEIHDQERRMRADRATIAPQDHDGVFTITTLAPQENP